MEGTPEDRLREEGANQEEGANREEGATAEDGTPTDGTDQAAGATPAPIPDETPDSAEPPKPEDAPTEVTSRRRRTAGVVLIVLGALFFVDSYFDIGDWARLWPLLLVLLGIVLIARSRSE